MSRNESVRREAKKFKHERLNESNAAQAAGKVELPARPPSSRRTEKQRERDRRAVYACFNDHFSIARLRGNPKSVVTAVFGTHRRTDTSPAALAPPALGKRDPPQHC